jgi:simple sugar transport system permease protein
MKIKIKSEFSLFFVIIIISIFFVSYTKEFYTLENILDLLTSYTFLGIMSAGMLVVLISGGIDISFTAIASISQYIAALYIINYKGNLFIAFVIAGGVGVILGIFNALIIHYLQAPALIVTIGTLNIYYSLLIFFTHGKWMYNFPEWFKEVDYIIKYVSNSQRDYGISLPSIILVSVFIVTYVLLEHTVLGRKIFAMGGNKESAKRMGFNLLTLNMFVYGYIGLLAGIASIAHLLIVQTVQPNALVGRELDVIAAAVIGGASLIGGAGSVLGTALGVTLIALMWNGIVLIGISSYAHNVIIGVIILVSVIITAYNNKKTMGEGARITDEF